GAQGGAVAQRHPRRALVHEQPSGALAGFGAGLPDQAGDHDQPRDAGRARLGRHGEGRGMRFSLPSPLRAAALALALAPAGPAALAQDAAISSPTAALALAENPDLHMVGVEALVVEIDEQHTRDLGLEYGFNPRTTDGGGNP